MRRTPLAVVASVVGTLLLVGVAEHLAAPDPRAAALAQLQAALASGAAPVDAAAPQSSSDNPPDASQATAPYPPGSITPEVIDEVTSGEGPIGTPEQIALRFMQALQRHDDLAALREAPTAAIGFETVTEEWTLHRVMNDVRRHSHLDGAPPCTNAKRFDTDEVIVSCGWLRVMVNTDAVGQGGVALYRPMVSGEYRYPHSYAISTIDD